MDILSYNLANQANNRTKTLKTDLEKKENKIARSTTAPISPVADDVWMDTSVTPHVLKRYDGATWVGVGGGGSSTAIDVSFSNANFTSTNVSAALDELFTNVSSGKSSIATAITDKGVTASGSDSFTVLQDKIYQISQTGGQALDTPSGLKVNFNFVTGVAEVVWDDLIYGQNNLAGYNVYLNGVKQNSTVVTTTSYSLSGLQKGSAYDVAVTSLSLDEVQSARTRTVPVATAVTFVFEPNLRGSVSTSTTTPIASTIEGRTTASPNRLSEGSWNITLT